jgi:chemotaxis-related protein WspD
MHDPSLPERDQSLTTTESCWKKIGVWGSRTCPELPAVIHCRNCSVYSTAAVRTLDRELPADYLDESTNHFAREKVTTDLKTESVLIFRVRNEWLALASVVLQEVCRHRPIHSVPHRRNRHVLGVANIRGELITCISLADFLDLDTPAPEDQTSHTSNSQRFLVVNRQGDRFVFPVDEIHSLQKFPPNDIRHAPATVSSSPAAYSKGMLSVGSRRVGYLDDEKLFQTLHRSLK